MSVQFMSENFCYVFFKEFYGAKSLHSLSLFLCMAGGCVLTSLISVQPSSFPRLTCSRDCLFPIVYLASSVEDELTIGVWVYFWALYSVALILCLFWCPFHTVLITVAL